MAEEDIDIKTHDAMNSLLGSWGRLLFHKPVCLVCLYFTAICEWKSVSEFFNKKMKLRKAKSPKVGANVHLSFNTFGGLVAIHSLIFKVLSKQEILLFNFFRISF